MLDQCADVASLRDWLNEADRDRHLHGRVTSVALADLVRGTSLGGRLPELAGRSVLVVTKALEIVVMGLGWLALLSGQRRGVVDMLPGASHELVARIEDELAGVAVERDGLPRLHDARRVLQTDDRRHAKRPREDRGVVRAAAGIGGEAFDA